MADQGIKQKNLLYKGMTSHQPYNEKLFLMQNDCWFFLLEELFKHMCEREKFLYLSL